jgi:hypothetical protein
MVGGPYGICDRCGFKYRLAKLRKEWTGLMVCPADWDPKPADLKPPRFGPEGLPARDARPEPPEVFRDPEDNGWADL